MLPATEQIHVDNVKRLAETIRKMQNHGRHDGLERPMSVGLYMKRAHEACDGIDWLLSEVERLRKRLGEWEELANVAREANGELPYRPSSYEEVLNELDVANKTIDGGRFERCRVCDRHDCGTMYCKTCYENLRDLSKLPTPAEWRHHYLCEWDTDEPIDMNSVVLCLEQLGMLRDDAIS